MLKYFCRVAYTVGAKPMVAPRPLQDLRLSGLSLDPPQSTTVAKEKQLHGSMRKLTMTGLIKCKRAVDLGKLNIKLGKTQKMRR